MLLVTLIFFGTLLPQKSFAVNPDEVLSDPILEQRARDLSTLLRCLVCQNQSIDDSDASLAKDLRVLVRTRLVSGDTNDQVMDYIVSRYGEFVLLQPRFGLHTLLLWVLPFFIIIIGFVAAFIMFRRRRTAKAASLTPEEYTKLSELIENRD
ncbi:MAG: cytochrome c-type biogenesis protein CcmH [Rhizobiaceae bacterium]|nr:cytochrome c-type biogenesis protein CcmH [Rhizobiaceae bacterium]